ncbi:MAG: hypothetical protein OEZ52_12915, partial [Candidatus Aminicenantes bacterium]|nr:hypothetical protein [Candidatus Aminicenantes bacterium]
MSTVLSAILIWFLLSQVELEDFAQTFVHIYIPGLLAFSALSLLGATLRAWRYKVLLQPQHISWGNI